MEIVNFYDSEINLKIESRANIFKVIFDYALELSTNGKYT